MVIFTNIQKARRQSKNRAIINLLMLTHQSSQDPLNVEGCLMKSVIVRSEDYGRYRGYVKNSLSPNEVKIETYWEACKLKCV